MSRLTYLLALVFLFSPRGFGQGQIAELSRAEQLTQELEHAQTWAEAEPLVFELGALGADARLALPILLSKVKLALELEESQGEVAALTRALGGIGARAPQLGPRGKWEVWCEEPAHLYGASEALLQHGTLEQQQAFHAIPGVLWDLAAGADARDFWIDAALVGLSNPDSAKAWAVALRSQYAQRPKLTLLQADAISAEINKAYSPNQALFLRCSLWGHSLDALADSTPSEREHSDLTTINGMPELVKSELAHEREAAAFLLANFRPALQDPTWMLGLLQDKDEAVRQTAIWAVGFVEFSLRGKSLLPFTPSSVPGAALTRPELSYGEIGAGGRFGGRLGDRSGDRAGRPLGTFFQQAEFLGTYYEPPTLPEPEVLRWGAVLGLKLQHELEGLAKQDVHKDMVYWTLCRFPGTEGRYRDRVEDNYRNPELNVHHSLSDWRSLITRAGGPSRAHAIRALAAIERSRHRSLDREVIEYVRQVASLEAQDLLVRQYSSTDRNYLGLVNLFPSIDGLLAELLLQEAQTYGGYVLSILPRCEGGPEQLATLLADDRKLIRLTAFVALAHAKKVEATPAVCQMYERADVDEQAFLKRWWSQVDPTVSLGS